MPRLVPIECLEWRHSNSRLQGCVVQKLHKRNPETPAPWTRMRKAAQKDLQALVDTLGLPISCRMVRSTHSQCCVGQTKELLPKSASEDGVTVRQNRVRQAVQSVNLINISSSHLRCREWVSQGQKMTVLGEFVHHHQKTIGSPR